MLDLLKPYALAFIPIFVAIDAVSLVPIYINITQGMDPAAKHRVIGQCFLTAAIVGIAFLFVGRGIFWVMGIAVSDFQIAGGIILLAVAIPDILGLQQLRRDTAGVTVGVVPLGIPLIVGPAVLTAMLLLADTYGYAPAITSLVVNLVLVVSAFLLSDRIIRLVGEPGVKAISKIVALLLAAYAVMLIRKGMTST